MLLENMQRKCFLTLVFANVCLTASTMPEKGPQSTQKRQKCKTAGVWTFLKLYAGFGAFLQVFQNLQVGKLGCKICSLFAACGQNLGLVGP